MPSALVRPLDLTDDTTAAAVHRIGRAAYAVEAELIGFDGIPALHESLAEMRARPLSWLGAVSEGGEIAGFLAWEEEPDRTICVDRLCVAPVWFRRGVASLLLRHLLTEVLPDRAVTVTTGAANAPAVTLYERLGFTRGADFSPAPGLRMASFTLPHHR
ncbi:MULTISPECIES: GNAT family N-acetyltransferase [unclassified Streptomyces]|uniref:GNAT family N-acetyltransferase n=1 Tax=unclassified Streptomyces TaxID=2593676 RepID=UPI001BEBDB60|nr:MULTISPECIES: GNAT family N-acetyltransferase [unclassified Streptomyces]MBT2403336.1 GNAT family N-acetyltransferase [Streptomyces sp. ISL-21]MBT2453785.1 GNAT family N-acetyltransferase [Streptomyces sp. ISL-86]MBT2613625.1 GNAT family N-acetyltransferase [Streptomyces sp. ISL-87]